MAKLDGKNLRKLTAILLLAVIWGIGMSTASFSQVSTQKIVAGRVYFSDFELATKLANLMTGGALERFIILSTAVVNDRNGYYILAKLSDGMTRRIFFDDLAKIKDDLVLADNYALILNTKNQVEFFDKNAFHRMAFAAKTYWKVEKFGAAYEAKQLPYLIKDFVLLDDAPYLQQSESGERYYYRLSLLNGDKVFLTLADAYDAYNRNAFVAGLSADYKSFGTLNNIEYIFARPKERLTQNFSQIILEVHFAKELEFTADMVAFNIKKINKLEPDNEDGLYYLDIYFPNTDFDPQVIKRTILKFGYFESVALIKDPQDKTRSILRAYLKESDYSFLSANPLIEIKDEKTLWVRYPQDIDQISRNFEYAKNQPADGVLFEIFNKYNSTPFYRVFAAALVKINQANASSSIQRKVSGMIDGISDLDKAGTYAADDYQLLDVIKAKEQTRQRIYQVVTDYLEDGLSSRSFNVTEAEDIIEKTEALVTDSEAIENLNRLKNQIIRN